MSLWNTDKWGVWYVVNIFSAFKLLNSFSLGLARSVIGAFFVFLFYFLESTILYCSLRQLFFSAKINNILWILCRVDKKGMICDQLGVFRVNCIDCLDRTNVVQSAIARIILETQVTCHAKLWFYESVKEHRYFFFLFHFRLECLSLSWIFCWQMSKS